MISKRLSIIAILAILFAASGHAENSKQATVSFTCPNPNKIQVIGGTISPVEMSSVWVLDNGLSGSIVPHSTAQIPEFLPVMNTEFDLVSNLPPTPTLEDFKRVLRQGGFQVIYATGEVNGNSLHVSCQYRNTIGYQQASLLFKGDFPGEFYTHLKCNRGANMEVTCG
jgi:hypothetical protein